MLGGNVVVRTEDRVSLPGHLVLDIYRTSRLDVDDGRPPSQQWDEQLQRERLFHATSHRMSRIQLVDEESGVSAMVRDLQDYIQRHPRDALIAVDLEGVDLGTDGTLCLMQLATPDQLYLFDVAVYKDGIPPGLRKILEDPHVTKLMHDCRKDSAMLSQHNIRLDGVFDSQVADILIRRNMTGQMPAYVRGLSLVLEQYLGISEDHLAVKKTGREMMREDERVWARRPIPDDLQKYAAFDVAALHALHGIMIEMMALELRIATQKYLGVVRDEGKDTANKVPEFESGMLRYLFRNMARPQSESKRN